MFEIIDEGPLPGLAESVKLGAASRPTPEDLASFAQALKDADLPIAAAMGVWDDLRALYDRLFHRRLVRDEPLEPRSMPFLECHVPPGGSVTIKRTQSRGSSQSGELKIFGSGIGAGRRTTIQLAETSGPRKRCSISSIDVVVRPRIFEVRGEETVELEVAEVKGETTSIIRDCPFCGLVPATLDPFEFRLGEHVDLRDDEVPSTRSMLLEIAGELSASLSPEFAIGGVGAKLALGVKISRAMTIEISSVFPPGSRYHAFTRLRTTALQTPMWAVEGARRHATA